MIKQNKWDVEGAIYEIGSSSVVTFRPPPMQTIVLNCLRIAASAICTPSRSFANCSSRGMGRSSAARTPDAVKAPRCQPCVVENPQS